MFNTDYRLFLGWSGWITQVFTQIPKRFKLVLGISSIIYFQKWKNSRSRQKIINQSLFVFFQGHRCSPCPEKWKWHEDKCYQFYKESKNWQGCEYFCLAENATMLKISTQEELVSSWASVFQGIPQKNRARTLYGVKFLTHIFPLLLTAKSKSYSNCCKWSLKCIKTVFSPNTYCT